MTNNDPPSDFMLQLEKLLDKKLDPIKNELANVSANVEKAIRTADEAKQLAIAAITKVDESSTAADSALRIATSMESRLADLEEKQARMSEQILSQEAYSRRNNLIFEGVPECPDEHLSETMRTLISKLGMDVAHVTLIACHRIPTGHRGGSRGKPRPVIIKFLQYDDRKAIWKLRNKSERGIWLKEDFPTDIENRRKTLWPYLKAAYQGDPSNPDGRVSAYLRLDKLHLNNQTFTHTTLDKIPPYIKNRVENPPPMRQSSDATIFFTKGSHLSNFHPSNFDVDGHSYSSVEQYLSHRKALLFGAEDVANNVMTMSEPVAMKRHVKQLPDFNLNSWKENAPTILYDGLCAKFTQNESLKAALLETGTTKLGEACKNTMFGIGFALSHSKALDIGHWHGDNLQGETLMRVRQAITDGII